MILVTIAAAVLSVPTFALAWQDGERALPADPASKIRCTARVGGTDNMPQYMAVEIRILDSDEAFLFVPYPATELYCERDDIIPTEDDVALFATGLGLEIAHGPPERRRLAYYEFDQVARELIVEMRMGELTAGEQERFDARRSQIATALADGPAE